MGGVASYKRLSISGGISGGISGTIITSYGCFGISTALPGVPSALQGGNFASHEQGARISPPCLLCQNML